MALQSFVAVGGGAVHEAKFFELAGDLTVEVEFIGSPEEADKLLALVREARIRVFYARVPAEFGAIEGE